MKCPCSKFSSGFPNPGVLTLTKRPYLICSVSASITVTRAQSLCSSCVDLAHSCVPRMFLRYWLACSLFIRMDCQMSQRSHVTTPFKISTIPPPLHFHCFAHFVLLLNILYVSLSRTGMWACVLSLCAWLCLCPLHQHLADSKCSLNIE